MTECSQCGDCCEQIHLSVDFNEMLSIKYKDWRNQYNQAFIATHWHPTETDPKRIGEIWGIESPGGQAGPHFKCDMFDSINRTCTAHDDRPDVCSGYPWYNYGIRKTDPFLPIKCSFWADVPVEIRPTGVTLEIAAV